MKAIEVLAFDPGSAHVGWARIRVSRVHAEWIEGGSLRIGTLEEDPIRKAQGKRARRIVTDEDLDELLCKAGTLCAEIGLHADLFVVERSSTVARVAGASSIASANWIGGEIAGFLRGIAHDTSAVVITVDPFDWRRSLGLGRSPKDAAVARVLALHFGGPLPANCHARDAAGAGLVAARRRLIVEDA